MAPSDSNKNLVSWPHTERLTLNTSFLNQPSEPSSHSSPWSQHHPLASPAHPNSSSFMLHQLPPISTDISDHHHPVQHLSPNEWNSLFSAPLNPAVFASLAANGVFTVPRAHQSVPNDHLLHRPPSSAFHNEHHPHSSWSHSSSHLPHRQSLPSATSSDEKAITPTTDHLQRLPHESLHHARLHKPTDTRRIPVSNSHPFHPHAQHSHPISRIITSPC